MGVRSRRHTCIGPARCLGHLYRACPLSWAKRHLYRACPLSWAKRHLHRACPLHRRAVPGRVTYVDVQALFECRMKPYGNRELRHTKRLRVSRTHAFCERCLNASHQAAFTVDPSNANNVHNANARCRQARRVSAAQRVAARRSAPVAGRRPEQPTGQRSFFAKRPGPGRPANAAAADAATRKFSARSRASARPDGPSIAWQRPAPAQCAACLQREQPDQSGL